MTYAQKLAAFMEGKEFVRVPQYDDRYGFISGFASNFGSRPCDLCGNKKNGYLWPLYDRKGKRWYFVATNCFTQIPDAKPVLTDPQEIKEARAAYPEWAKEE